MNKSLTLVATAGVLAMYLPARAQHIDVLAQVVNGQLVTGAANYDNNTWLVGQRVFKRQFFSNFRTPDPGFTTLATGNPLLEPGVQGLATSTNLFFEIVPTSIDGLSANFWWWDGVDTGDDGFTLDDVAFGLAPAGVTWEVLDDDFSKHIADGSDTVVPGAFIQEAFDDGGVHNHLVLQLADNDGDSQTSPPQGVYLAAMVLRAEGFEDSEPFFFVHRTSQLSNDPRDNAAAWVNANYDALVSDPLQGDYNFDGAVDAADYTVWRAGLGASFEPSDYDVWRDNYGATLTAESAALGNGVSVPEPAGVMLAAAAAVMGLVGRRVRRSASGEPRATNAVAAVMLAVSVVGCSRSEPSSLPSAVPEVPYVAAAEVAELLASPGPPTVLEFCVPVGCFRCDEMREPINTMAQSEASSLRVRRINLITDAALARQWGVTVCPSYVVIDGGRELARAVYPTSADLIAAMVPGVPATK